VTEKRPTKDEGGSEKDNVVTLRRCSRCILPTTCPGITFTEQGICNRCLAYRRKVPRGEEALGRLIQACQNDSKEYDCIVAVSGRRDSAFAAYYAAKVLGPRALLYPFDNGFLPDQTKVHCLRNSG
jgi:glucosamine--fructose-6-phosphate aminotransferase (isomerizing)